MKSLITVAMAAAVVGCAADNNAWAWGKPGATQQAFYEDHGQCRAQAFSVPGVTVLQAALVLDGCMQGKGWQRVPSSSAIAAAPAPVTAAAPQTKGCELVKDANGDPALVCP